MFKAIGLLRAVAWNPRDWDEYGPLDATPDEIRATLALLGRIQAKINELTPMLETHLQKKTGS